MKNAFAEFAEVLERIDHLADQMRRVPFDAEIVVTRQSEKFIPNGGLAKNIPMRDRQMPRALRTMFESDAHAAIAGALGERFPKLGCLRQKFFRRRINRSAAALVEGRFN